MKFLVEAGFAQEVSQNEIRILDHINTRIETDKNTGLEKGSGIV